MPRAEAVITALQAIGCSGDRPRARPGWSCSSPAPAPTCRRCSTPAPTRRTAPRSSPSAPTGTASPGWTGPAHAGVPTFVARCRRLRRRATDWDARADRARAPSTSPIWWSRPGSSSWSGRASWRAFGGRYLNTHNALLPAFPGIHGPRDALAYGVKVAGATLFFVDAGVDTGPIIAQVAVPVLDDDTEETLTERIKEAERRQLVDTSAAWSARAGPSPDRKVTIP